MVGQNVLYLYGRTRIRWQAKPDAQPYGRPLFLTAIPLRLTVIFRVQSISIYGLLIGIYVWPRYPSMG